MKSPLLSLRRWVALTMALLSAMAALAPGPVVGAPPPPHRNPATVESAFDALTLLRYYASTLVLLGDRSYGDAQRLLAKLKYIDLPADLRFIVQRYSGLLGDLGAALDSGEKSLALASAWLAQGDREKAQAELPLARGQLAQARLLLEDLREATRALAERLGIFAAPADSPLRLAYARLEELLGRLQGLEDQLREVLQRLEAGELAPGPLEPRLALYATRLEFSLPPRGYPGLPLRVWGKLSPAEGPGWSSRQVRVLLEERPLGEFTTSGDSFDSQVVIPADVSVGYHELMLTVMPEGQYGGASQSRPLEVVRAVPTLEVLAPSFAFLWRGLGVSGRAHSEFGPLERARVILGMEGASVQVATDEGGRFRASLSPSRSPFLLGPRRLRITLEPREPWHAPVSQQVSLMVANPAQGGILALALFYLGALLVVTRRPRRPGAREGAPDLSGPPRDAAPGPAPSGAKGPAEAVPKNPRDEVLLAYWSAQKVTERATGMALTPSTTLRGYLRALGPPRPVGAFAELTGLAEVALYSGQVVGPEKAARAQELLARVTSGVK